MGHSRVLRGVSRRIVEWSGNDDWLAGRRANLDKYSIEIGESEITNGWIVHSVTTTIDITYLLPLSDVSVLESLEYESDFEKAFRMAHPEWFLCGDEPMNYNRNNLELNFPPKAGDPMVKAGYITQDYDIPETTSNIRFDAVMVKQGIDIPQNLVGVESAFDKMTKKFEVLVELDPFDQLGEPSTLVKKWEETLLTILPKMAEIVKKQCETQWEPLDFASYSKTTLCATSWKRQ